MFALRVLRLLTLVAAFPAVAPGALAADELLPLSLPFSDSMKAFSGRMETSTGVDMTGNSQSAYSSVVIAPLGPLDRDGLRIKLYGSYGAWSYDRQDSISYCLRSPEERVALTGVDFSRLCHLNANERLSEAEAEAISLEVAPYGLKLKGDQLYKVQTHKVERIELAALPGYQMNWPGAALKAYLGPALETRTITPDDPDKTLSGTAWGARTGLESWIALGGASWLAADAGYFTGTQAYNASMRLGYQALGWLTLGPEVAAFGDVEDDSTRAGGFLRLTIGEMEATISGGMSADYVGTTGAYGSAGIYMKF
jgi:hypothetical protein